MGFFYSAIISTVLHLKRLCPKCRRKQIIPAKLRHQSVPCKFCQADILPPIKDR